MCCQYTFTCEVSFLPPDLRLGSLCPGETQAIIATTFGASTGCDLSWSQLMGQIKL